MTKTEYKTLENTKKGGILTIRIEAHELAYNHTLIHEKEVFEPFEADDIGLVVVNNCNFYHINGRVITPREFKFIKNIIEDL